MAKNWACFRVSVLFMWYLLKSDLKRYLKQLMNWKTLLLFVIVMIVMSCEVWIPYIIYFCTDNELWLGIGSGCWIFWANPGTPFLELCIIITLGIRSMWIKFKKHKLGNKE